MASKKLELTEDQQAKFKWYYENVHYKTWGKERVKCTFYKCEECGIEVDIQLGEIKRRIKADRPLICSKCSAKNLHLIRKSPSREKYSLVVSTRGASKNNTTGYVGVSFNNTNSCIYVYIQITYKYLGKHFLISYSSDDDLKCGAWLRDDYIRSMGYPHALNFSDGEHESLRVKYQNHPKKDWVSKIKDKECK